MKKLICLLLLCILFIPYAWAQGESTQGEDNFTLWFEDGFSLSIPEGWVSYPSGDAGEPDIRYVLGDADGSRYMYIQRRATALEDIDALDAALTAHESYEKTGELRFNGQTFLAFIAADLNASGCMTILDGHLLTFIFTPQTDSDYMLLAAEIMDSFSSLAG